MVPQWSLDSSVLRLNAFGIEINNFKPNSSAAKLTVCSSLFLLPPYNFVVQQATQILNQQADDNMNNSSTVLQVWVKALRVNHKSTWRKTNKLLRERDEERSDAQAAPGNITFPPHRRFTQLDEGCGPIMCCWRKHPRLQRWWRESLGRRQKGLAKGSTGPLKRVWSSYKMRLTWSQNSLLDAIFFRKVSQLGQGCDVKSSRPCGYLEPSPRQRQTAPAPGGQCSSVTLITAAE